MVMSRGEIERLERAAARAWPAERTATIDGWIVRHSGGGSRRANSVLPLAFAGRDVDVAIDQAEAHYRGCGLPAYFQVSEIAAPDDLDARLAARGYTLEEPTLLMSKALAAVPMPGAVELRAAVEPAWLAIYGADLTPDRRAGAPAVLARVPMPRQFFLARNTGGEAVATALGVVVDGVTIVECVATDPATRRQGHGRHVMQALEGWAAITGSKTVALQVVVRNSGARALYEGLGYRAASRYHYRVKAL